MFNLKIEGVNNLRSCDGAKEHTPAEAERLSRASAHVFSIYEVARKNKGHSRHKAGRRFTPTPIRFTNNEHLLAGRCLSLKANLG